MIDEQELDKIQSEVEQDIIDQRDKIDPNVEQHLQEMGYIWDKVHDKLQNDNICFVCKKPLKIEDEKQSSVYILDANNVDKGVCAFVSVCKECFNSLNKKE